MKRAFHTLLCLLTAVQLCGGNLGVAQMIAWAKMVSDYTHQKGFVEGVKETFDGDHPCEYCVRIAEEREKEDKQAPVPLDKKGEKNLGCLGLAPEMESPRARPETLSGKARFADPLLVGAQNPAAPATPPPKVFA